jgi:hypothetical protein
MMGDLISASIMKKADGMNGFKGYSAGFDYQIINRS